MPTDPKLLGATVETHTISTIEVHGKAFPDSPLFKKPTDLRAHREYRMLQHLDDFYWKVFFLLKMNKVRGDYAEFGSGSNVRSIRFALKYNQMEVFDRRIFSFDSFEGLPEPTGCDVHPQWHKGQMAVSLEQFHALLAASGYSRDDYFAIKGFYEQTLTPEASQKFGLNRVAFAHIDCDLYSSTVRALEFVLPLMTHGSVLSFDDWFCFNGTSDKGEQKAFHEVKAQYPHLEFMDLYPFGWHGKSFLVHHMGTT